MLAVCALMQSCIYEDLQECGGEFYGCLTVVNDWVNAPDANPEGMGYFFFPAAGGAYWRFDLAGRDGGEIKIPTGDYNLLLFNDDTANVIETDTESFGSMSLSTPACEPYPGYNEGKSHPEAMEAQNQPSLTNPDMVWSTSADGVKVELTNGDQRVTTYPEAITATYHIIINNVTNLDGVAQMSGAMSGMARSVRLSDRTLSEQAVILPSGLKKAGTDGIRGDFHTFGRCATEATPNILFLFIGLTNGKRYVYDIDVTKAVKTAPDPMDVWIRIDSLDLPESEPSQGGAFDVEVDGWTHVSINM